MQHHEGIIRTEWNLMLKRLVLVQINDEISKAKEKKCSKSVFGGIITSCNRCWRTTGMESNWFWLSDCGRKFPNACMHSQKLCFKAAGHRSRARRRPTKFHACSTDDISDELVGQGRNCKCWIQHMFLIIFATCGRSVSYWKIAPGMPWR